MYKFALIHIGTHEVYGLCYVAAEIAKCGHSFRWFDGEDESFVNDIVEWIPDFMCCSPLSAFFDKTIELTKQIKNILPATLSVYGGIHVSSIPEIVRFKEIDFVVIGPVDGTIDTIIQGKPPDVIKGQAVDPKYLKPEKRSYYEQIPRIGNRHVKTIMSHFGCIFNCAYCSTWRIRGEYSSEDYKRHWLSRRPLEDIIEEARLFLVYPTSEVELSDDDMLYGDDVDVWMKKFATAWKNSVDLPLFGNVTPFSVLRVSDDTLDILSNLVCNVCIGLQSSDDETLRLFNRHFQTRQIFEKAIDRLQAFNIPVKIDIIIGNPVKDPVSEAIETIKYAQTVSNNRAISTVFPLMLYPGTKLTNWCMENNIPLNEECQFNWYSGVGSLKFNNVTAKKLRNLAKLGNFFIANKIPEHWIRALIDVEIGSDASHSIANCNYHDSLSHHGKSEGEIEKILEQVKLYY